MRAGAILGQRWDAIVVGAGIGGLVTAALLSRAGGMRVLVLERHHELGGLSQTFHRRRFSWDVGVHYVGDLGPAGPLRALYDHLTGGRLRWAALPDAYDHLFSRDTEARLGGSFERARDRLLATAPGHAAAIDRWLGELRACARAAVPYLLSRMRGDVDSSRDRSPFFAWADVTTLEMAEKLRIEPELLPLLLYMWGNYGTPPERSSFAAHAIATAHYFSGAAYPVGGGGRIARELCPAILERGAIVVRAEVDAIVADGSVRGIRLRSGEEIAAPIVVSDAGARTTADVLGRDLPALDALRERTAAIGRTHGHVGLYLGYETPPAALGLDGSNVWIGDDPLGDSRSAGAWAAGERDAAPGVFLSLACARDPSAGDRLNGRTAITATVLAPYAPFAPWESSAWQRRDASYAAHKDRLGRSILAAIAARLPALGAPDHLEVSTPLSTRAFTAHGGGEVAGLAHTPGRFRRGPAPTTAVRGLFLSGQDLWLGGVGGASFGGVLAASTILRRDLAREVVMPGEGRR